MKRFALITLLALTPLVAACNTIQGIGEDVTAVGDALEDAAS